MKALLNFLRRLFGGGKDRPRVEPAPLLPALGIVVHSPQDHAPGVRELGFKYIRYTVYWHLWERVEYQEKVQADFRAAAGFDVLLVLHGHGTDLKEFIQFAQAVVEGARALLPHFAVQAWNEVDEQFPGYRFLEPMSYVGHLLDLRAALPAGTFLVSAGLASTGARLRYWVSAIHNANVVDAIAVHAYGWPLSVAFADRAQVVLGLTGKKAWCTEFGQERKVIPSDHPAIADWEEDQRGNLLQCAQDLDRQRLYDRAYVYVYRDDVPNGHSLIRPDGSHRPAAYALMHHQRDREKWLR